MKFCYQCGHVTAGKPLFCSFCGRTFDVKLCPRLHANPRFADVCSQCGSRELSRPQPKVALWWRVLALLLQIALGSFLVFLTLEFVAGILKTEFVQNAMVVLGLLLMALWAVWIVLPEWLRKLLHRLLRRKEERHER
jgi:hypothetical protein